MAITKTVKSFISDFITPTKFQYVAVSEILYAFISDIITTTKVECMAMQPISTSKFSVQDTFHSMYHSRKSELPYEGYGIESLNISILSNTDVRILSVRETNELTPYMHLLICIKIYILILYQATQENPSSNVSLDSHGLRPCFLNLFLKLYITISIQK